MFKARWKIVAFVALLVLLGSASHYFHWHQQLLFWVKETTVRQKVREQSIWLPDYEAVIQAKELPGLEKYETSALTWNPATQTLFSVTGKIPQLVEISPEGELLRRIELEGFADPEGVEVIDAQRMAIIDERRGEMVVFKLPIKGDVLRYAELVAVNLGIVKAGNKGFEGIAWDAVNQRMILAKERSPYGLFSLPFPDDNNFPKTLQELPSKHLFVRDMSSLAIDPRTGHMLVLSDESRLLVELDENGETVSYISLVRGFNGLKKSINQAEGVAIDEHGTIYLVSEPNLFYVFKKPKN